MPRIRDFKLTALVVHGIALCATVLLSLDAYAAVCPIENLPGLGFASVCTVTEDDSTFTVFARGDPGGILQTTLVVDGKLHFVERIFVFELGTGIQPDTVLQSATFETASRTIQVVLQLLDTVFDSFVIATATANFSLDDLGPTMDLTEVTQTAIITSTVSDSYQGRLYALVDFDLNETFLDDEAAGGIGGITVTDGNGFTFGTFEVTGGSPPNAFQVAVWPTLENPLTSGTLINLTNSLTPGPADIEAAFSWDDTFSFIGDSFSTTFTIAVPEPGMSLLMKAGLLVLTFMGQRRGRKA